jgi:hypothetical protein
MTNTNPAQRHALISGLRELADFLEINPDVPAPDNASILVFPPHDSPDSEKRREIDHIAAQIGSGTEISPSHRHYMTSRRFGPVEYRAVAIPANDHEEE